MFSGFSPGPQTFVFAKFGAGDAQKVVPMQTNIVKKPETLLITTISELGTSI